MAESNNDKLASYTKVAWAIYTLLVIVLMVVFVTVIARDNEERLFYPLMTAAVAYVFRPTDKFFRKLVTRFTGVQAEEESENGSAQ